MSEACAYLISRYPIVTHTFIADEVRALRAAGVRVETATVRRPDPHEVLGDAAHEEHARTHALLPVAPSRLAAAHARALARSPAAYAATLAGALRLAHAGGRARLWQLFYFAEAILLWAWMTERGLRHVHVHHANVASDVAMLACRYANRSGAGRRWTWSLTIHGPAELVDVTTHKIAAKAADASAVMCTSDFARSQVAAQVPADRRDHLHTVRSGIDTSAFRPSPRPPAGDGAAPTVLCVGALAARKGQDVLLDALALLRDRGVPARVALVGDGPERAALERRARALGIADAVRFAGAVAHDAVPGWYARADAFCLPSFAEGVPTVLQEAMACEVPVVATPIAGTGELVEHERTGLLVPPARPDLLAGALERLLTDAELRERLGRAGREKVLADYDLARCAGRLREALGPLIEVGDSRSVAVASG